MGWPCRRIEGLWIATSAFDKGLQIKGFVQGKLGRQSFDNGGWVFGHGGL